MTTSGLILENKVAVVSGASRGIGRAIAELFARQGATVVTCGRKQETLDEFFRTQLREGQRKRIESACVDMWQPYTNSIQQWAANCRIIYDKFRVLQHANRAIDEVRRAEFFRKGQRLRECD